MRILVTGAAGYIGSALVKALAGHEVVATDQSAPAPVVGNLAYPQFARSLITPDVDAVFHLAALVSGGAEQNFELGTKVNLDATRDLLERTQPDDIGVSVAYPLLGTKFFDLVKRELGSKRNWEESNDLDMMFVGTYRSEFYRSIRNLLHAQVAEGSSAAVRRRWDALLRSEAEFRLRREVSAATRVAAHRAP